MLPSVAFALSATAGLFTRRFPSAATAHKSTSKVCTGSDLLVGTAEDRQRHCGHNSGVSNTEGSPWLLRQLPFVSPEDAAAATRMDRPFRYPTGFTDGWKVLRLDLDDVQHMYGVRPAGIGFGSLIDQFEDNFFE